MATELNVTAGVGGKSYMNYNKVPTKLREFCDELNAVRGEIASYSLQQKYEWTFDAHFKLLTIEKTAKSREKIISLLDETNSLSASALADLIGITPKAVEKHISKLKAEGVLRRVGPDKGGHWEIVK